MRLLAMSLSRHTVEVSLENVWDSIPYILDKKDPEIQKIKKALKVVSEDLLWDMPYFLIEDEEEENEDNEYEVDLT